MNPIIFYLDVPSMEGCGRQCQYIAFYDHVLPVSKGALSK